MWRRVPSLNTQCSRLEVLNGNVLIGTECLNTKVPGFLYETKKRKDNDDLPSAANRQHKHINIESK